MNSTIGYTSATVQQSGIQDDFISLYFSVNHHKHGSYEVHVHSNDGKHFKVHKETTEGYDDFEGIVII